MATDFRAQLTETELEQILPHHFSEQKVLEDTALCSLVQKLTDAAYPSKEDEYTDTWSFYVPVRRKDRCISVPFSIIKYRREEPFFLSFRRGTLTIKPGEQKATPPWQTVLEDVLHFGMEIQRTGGKAISVPYDLRTGKIKLKYLVEDTDVLMTIEESRQLQEQYQSHVLQGRTVQDISLNDYLNTAAIGYRAAYGEEVAGKTPLAMYKAYADGRHGYMLEIKDQNSVREFQQWYDSEVRQGSHPFEIVYSPHHHGIHLWPPDADRARYRLGVTDLPYAKRFIAMTEAFMANEVSFEAMGLDKVLEYLTGESYAAVNGYGLANGYTEHTLWYTHSPEEQRKFFPHIEWDELPVPKWKAL